MAICSSFSFNQSVLWLSLDLPTDRAEDVMRDCGGRAAVKTAGGEAGAYPGRHAADPQLQLHPSLLIHHPRPRQHDRRRFLFIIIQLVLINIKLKVNGKRLNSTPHPLKSFIFLSQQTNCIVTFFRFSDWSWWGCCCQDREVSEWWLGDNWQHFYRQTRTWGSRAELSCRYYISEELSTIHVCD